MNFLIVLWLIWIMSEIFLAKFSKAEKSKIDYDKSSLKIIWLTISISIFIGVLLRNTPFLLTTTHYNILYYSGISLIIIGLFIRWIAILKLKTSFTVNVSVTKDQKLITTSIYKYIRHPAYLGSLLSFLGLGILFNNWLTVTIIFVPIFTVFMYRINIEEKVLTEAFGKEYQEYSKQSGKLIPKVF